MILNARVLRQTDALVTAYIVACINCRRRQYMLHELSSAYIVVSINCRQYVSAITAHTDVTHFTTANDNIYMYDQ